jgi:propionyl-CoA carboxylase beta chain
MNELVAEYTERFANPYLAAEKGYIDEVIVPDQMRIKLIKGFAMLENKVVTLPRKKHGNIPL